MASCKFDGGKCHGAGDVKAALRHNDCAPEMRAVAAKGNPDIDVSKSGLNTRLYGGTYSERCEKYDNRIAELDAQPGANKRKDRTTGQLIEVPVPKDLPRGQYNDWMKRVVELMVARFGDENMISADGHWDEEHEYINERGENDLSRVHVQLVVVPVVDGRLCGKEFYSRKTMRELNDAVQAMSEKEYGVQFMDGTKAKGKKSTEQLKAESRARAEAQAAEIVKKAEARCKVMYDDTVGRLNAKKQMYNDEIGSEKKKLQVRESAVAARERDLNEYGRKLQDFAENVSEAAQEVSRDIQAYRGGKGTAAEADTPLRVYLRRCKGGPDVLAAFDAQQKQAADDAARRAANARRQAEWIERTNRTAAFLGIQSDSDDDDYGPYSRFG